MGIISLAASLLGVPCSKNTISVEFINAQDQCKIAVLEMPVEKLPDTFAVHITFEMMNRKWSVDKAEPMHKVDFIKTRKLRVFLWPQTTIRPGDHNILFSLPTISHELGEATGDAIPSAKIFALREDDWRQVEFVSKSLAPVRLEEFKDIERIYTNEKVGAFFKTLHARKRIPNPLGDNAISLPELERFFSPVKKFEAVGFQKMRGTIPGGFAWSLGQNLTLWGLADAKSNVKVLCILGHPDPDRVSSFSEALASFTSQKKLEFVDWCRCAAISSDPEAFAEYFQPPK